MEQAALRETVEEAGVVGKIEVSIYIQTYFGMQIVSNQPIFVSYLLLYWLFLQSKLGKWSYKSKRQAIVHEGYMFPMLVKNQLEDWPEKNIRKRKWVCIQLI